MSGKMVTIIHDVSQCVPSVVFFGRLKPLTPKMKNPNEDQLQKLIRLKGPIQQHEHQPQDQATTRSMQVLKKN